MDQQVEYSLIRIFRLLRQILRSLGEALGILDFRFNLNYFLGTVTVRIVESPLQIYFGELILSLTGKIMLISLIDYFTKQLSIFNDCWNSNNLKQQYQLISLVQNVFCKNDIYQLVL